MAAVWLIVRSELGRRLRSLCLVALLIGLVGAVVLSALAGARRTDSALARLMDQTLNDTASVEVSPEYFDAISTLPQVEAVAPASFMFVRPDGLEADDLLTMAGTDERFGTAVNRPRLREGRRPLPHRSDEVLLNSQAADRLQVGPGDRLSLSSLAPQQLERLIAGEDPGEPSGPTLEVVVVGVGVVAEGLANRALIVLFTPAFYAAHRDDVAHFDDILSVRLRRDEVDLDAFRDGVQRVVPESEGAVVETSAETIGEFEDAIDVQTTALVAFALAAALAGCVVVAQALSREIGQSSIQVEELRALGLNPRLQLAAVLLPMAFVAIGGAIVAVAGAWLTSPITPTGFARRAEPDPGFATDWIILGLGFIAILFLVCVGSAMWAGSVVGRRHRNAERHGPSRVLGELGRVGLPPTAVVGVQGALQSGGGRSSVPVRPALAAAVVGIAGLVAALTFRGGLDWVVSDRAAYGWRWDASVSGPTSGDELNQLASTLTESSDVESVAALNVLPVTLDGETITSYGLRQRTGASFVTVLEGREPRGDDEVLVGSQTLGRLGHEIGDRIRAASLQGSGARTLTIVGRGVFPEFIHPAVPDSDTGAYNDFALLTEAGNEAFVDDAGGEYFALVLVAWKPGVDVTAAQAVLSANGLDVEPTSIPSNLSNLTQVESFPLLVAAFLVVLAIAALVHALATSVRRRRRDLAVLRTLGFVSSQLRAMLAAQASTIAAIGLVIGIPVGIVSGRLVWALVARDLGVDTHVPTPVVAILATIAVSLVLANVAAILPARAAARAPVEVLRRE